MQIEPSIADEKFLLDLLNSTPLIDGAAADLLAGSSARQWLRAHGGTGSPAERAATRSTRNLVADLARGRAEITALGTVLRGVRSVPSVGGGGIVWDIETAPSRRLAVRAVLAWAAVNQRSPGRLRPCANPDCALFFIDHSKANRGRWCAMATCGNRMKARRHYQRSRSGPAEYSDRMVQGGGRLRRVEPTVAAARTAGAT